MYPCIETYNREKTTKCINVAPLLYSMKIQLFNTHNRVNNVNMYAVANYVNIKRIINAMQCINDSYVTGPDLL